MIAADVAAQIDAHRAWTQRACDESGARTTEAATAAASLMVAQRVDEAVRAAGAHIETRVAGAEQAVEFVQQQQHGTQVLWV